MRVVELLEDRLKEYGGMMQFIGSGGDSKVFRLDQERVIKLYHRPTIEQVELYAAITNLSADLLIARPCIGSVSFLGRQRSFGVFIEPVLETGFDPESRTPWITAGYIPGPTIVDLTRSPIDARRLLVDTLWDSNERRKLRKDKNVLPMDNQDLLFRQLSWFLGFQLGVQGINISAGNVKVNIDSRLNQLMMIVTDLCGGFGCYPLKI